MGIWTLLSLQARQGAAHKKQNALHGGGKRLSVRAVKAAGLAFIGAQRRALTEEAGGSGAGFGQEGQANLASVLTITMLVIN